MVKYTYDAWGNCRVLNPDGTENTEPTFVGNRNPFRYRGYYFDTETGLYFLKTRYYDPAIGRFMTLDDFAYLDPDHVNGLNLYAYCNNNPVMYVDPTGHFPILALILGIVALVGMGLTIGGVVSDNNTLTAVGLTMIAIPALISGGLAIAAGIGGATFLGIIGGGTVLAGLGTGLFASAEYQEAITGQNWMLDAGMNEEVYNSLMLITASLATVGTISCGVLSSIGSMSSQTTMMKSWESHPNHWKVVKQEIDKARRRYRGGISTYANYVNRWTGAKLGVHTIVRNGIMVHGPHIHPWI